jgi:hypothetical protein
MLVDEARLVAARRATRMAAATRTPRNTLIG